jgi:hypothetical protein
MPYLSQEQLIEEAL